MVNDLILALDTSTARCSVALGGPGGLLYEWQAWAPQSHAELLHPALGRALQELDCPSSGASRFLRAVAVTTGPGSFTGLRIGLAAAKGLAHAWSLPLAGLPTLQVMAWAVMGGDAQPDQERVPPQSRGGVLVAIATRSTNCYAAVYAPAALPGHLPRQLGGPVAAPPAEALRECLSTAAGGGLDPRGLVICGAPWRSPACDLPAGACLGQERFDWPSASSLVRAAALHLAAGGGQPPGAVLPLYVTRSPQREPVPGPGN